MIVRLIVTLLSGVGLYCSLFMLNKSRRARRGEIRGPSVVKSPRAQVLGVPNSLLGTIYYPVLAGAIWFVHGRLAVALVLAAVLLAAVSSAFLAYSLLFVTRRECPFCWTSHAVNWTLLIVLSWLLWRPS